MQASDGLGHPPSQGLLPWTLKEGCSEGPSANDGCCCRCNHCKPLLCCLPLQAVRHQMMVQSSMCVGNVCSTYGCAIQPQHWTSNHHLHSTLYYPSPFLPHILHADAILSSRSPHPCKGIPPASKHPWLFILRERHWKHWKKIKRKPSVWMSNNAHVPWPSYLWPLLWKLF